MQNSCPETGILSNYRRCLPDRTFIFLGTFFHYQPEAESRAGLESWPPQTLNQILLLTLKSAKCQDSICDKISSPQEKYYHYDRELLTIYGSVVKTDSGRITVYPLSVNTLSTSHKIILLLKAFATKFSTEIETFVK